MAYLSPSIILEGYPANLGDKLLRAIFYPTHFVAHGSENVLRLPYAFNESEYVLDVIVSLYKQLISQEGCTFSYNTVKRHNPSDPYLTVGHGHLGIHDYHLYLSEELQTHLSEAT